MTGTIYKITNLINNKSYIGQTIQNLKDRWYRHCGTTKNQKEENMSIKRAIKKYGKQNFTIEPLEIIDNCTMQQLNDREKYWIAKYDTYKQGYNQTYGGQDGAKLPMLIDQSNEIIKQYQSGKSLRQIAKNYDVCHATIKLILKHNNIPLRITRTYKLSQNDRVQILQLLNDGVSRKEIMAQFHISKSYVSQLVNGSRRI